MKFSGNYVRLSFIALNKHEQDFTEKYKNFLGRKMDYTSYEYFIIR